MGKEGGRQVQDDFEFEKLNQWDKMDTLELTLKLVTHGVFKTSLDFKDAYYSLAMHQVKQSRKYLR